MPLAPFRFFPQQAKEQSRQSRWHETAACRQLRMATGAQCKAQRQVARTGANRQVGVLARHWLFRPDRAAPLRQTKQPAWLPASLEEGWVGGQRRPHRTHLLRVSMREPGREQSGNYSACTSAHNPTPAAAASPATRSSDNSSTALLSLP